jgi:hypothetical protein
MSCRPVVRDEEEPVTDFQAIADRVEIEALRGEFTDAAMMRDYDRTAPLFTERVYEVRYEDTTPLRAQPSLLPTPTSDRRRQPCPSPPT